MKFLLIVGAMPVVGGVVFVVVGVVFTNFVNIAKFIVLRVLIPRRSMAVISRSHGERRRKVERRQRVAKEVRAVMRKVGRRRDGV